MIDRRIRFGYNSYMRYEFIWQTWKGRGVLRGNAKRTLGRLLSERAKELGWVIESLEVTDHEVGIVVSVSDPRIKPYRIQKQLKQASGTPILEYYELGSKMPQLWTSAYLVRTLESPWQEIPALKIHPSIRRVYKKGLDGYESRVIQDDNQSKRKGNGAHSRSGATRTALRGVPGDAEGDLPGREDGEDRVPDKP